MIGKLHFSYGLLVFCILSLASATASTDAAYHFHRGLELYNSSDYPAALTALQKAVELAPENSVYHHMLGKCYGRIAEQGNWLTALRYVGRTLSEFRRAVELDNGNVPAWVDLEEFYRRAPGFLGGDKEKAANIRLELEKLMIDQTGESREAGVP